MKKLSLELWKCIVGRFQLGHDFTHLASQRLFLCATFLDSEPSHFGSKSVEFWHALLYRWPYRNKLTLDLSRFVWKSFVEIPLVVTFFLIVKCSRIVAKILKMWKYDEVH